MRSVAISIDSRFATVLVTVTGDLEGAAFVEALSAWFNRRPLAAALDRLYDLTAFTGVVGQDDLRALAARLPEGALTPQALTVIATRDRFFPVWVRMLQLLAPGRHYLVEPTLPAAWATLAIWQDMRLRDAQRRRPPLQGP
ncbi:hypothetical protein [Falsiroseomonas sp.]|uniref:hypothetical protein n=1 Tax=Falsiroseomonas sp. TaxID=2870721 RepID=UPI003F6F3D98